MSKYGFAVGNTLVDYPRLDKLIEFSKATKNINGNVAEVGVYKGGTAWLLCDNERNRHVYLFDTFNGMPPVKSIDLHNEGDFADTSIRHIKNLLRFYNHYSIYKGIFPRVNTEYIQDEVFSLVHLDVDIYDSVKECLEYFIPKMSKGGIIVLDDYLEPHCPGAKQAADEVAAAHGLTVVPTVQSQAMIQF